jgi:hypothetical protein
MKIRLLRLRKGMIISARIDIKLLISLLPDLTQYEKSDSKPLTDIQVLNTDRERLALLIHFREKLVSNFLSKARLHICNIRCSITVGSANNEKEV